jgi:hypothetical protein
MGKEKGEVGVVRRREKRIKNGDENADVRENKTKRTKNFESIKFIGSCRGHRCTNKCK